MYTSVVDMQIFEVGTTLAPFSAESYTCVGVTNLSNSCNCYTCSIMTKLNFQVHTA
jgi:hypothetical protein